MIPLSIPFISGNEWTYVKECLDSGWISSAGSFVNRFEDAIAEYTGAKYAIACVNGTSGLHLATWMFDIKEGDHIIVPNITFIASANAASYSFAKPIFVDVDARTWQMDLDLLENYLADNTIPGTNYPIHNTTGKEIKAIMPVHVLGNICDMDRLIDIAKKYRLHVIEDATESLGSYYGSNHSGTFGDFGVFSFNGNKVISTGGGGMLVTDNEQLAKRAKHLSTQSKTNPDTYYHDEIGFNYRMVNILAAIGVAQMEKLDEILAKKELISNLYKQKLVSVGDIKFQETNPKTKPNNWLITISSNMQGEILEALKKSNIIARPLWTPMNQLPMFKENVYVTVDDVSKRIHQNCLSIPSSASLTEEDLDKVVKTIKDCFA